MEKVFLTFLESLKTGKNDILVESIKNGFKAICETEYVFNPNQYGFHVDETCDTCEGSGKVGNYPNYTTCPDCHGTGLKQQTTDSELDFDPNKAQEGLDNGFVDDVPWTAPSGEPGSEKWPMGDVDGDSELPAKRADIASDCRNGLAQFESDFGLEDEENMNMYDPSMDMSGNDDSEYANPEEEFALKNGLRIVDEKDMHEDDCVNCHGQGFIGDSVCPFCKGTGKIEFDENAEESGDTRSREDRQTDEHNASNDDTSNTRQCEFCDGKGYDKWGFICDHCHGKGFTQNVADVDEPEAETPQENISASGNDIDLNSTGSIPDAEGEDNV